MKKNLLFILGVLLILSAFAFSNGSSIAKQPISTNIPTTIKAPTQATYKTREPSQVGAAPSIYDSTHIPNTLEAQEIMRTIERAYDIERGGGTTFDLKLKKFPTVFINDPRFNEEPASLDAIRRMTHNPSLKSAGFLDYKLAYHTAIHEEVLQSLVRNAQGKSVPTLQVDAFSRKTSLLFMSIVIKDDIATVVLDDGATTPELTLVLVDKHWYIAKLKILSVHP
jgi:hypothetical protein